MKKQLHISWQSIQKTLLGGVLMVFCLASLAQSQNISGRITASENGEPLPGVSVLIKGTNQGTSTDNTGKYTLRLPSANATVVVSFIGYLKQEIAVGSRTVIDVALDVDTKALEEVVVVGYGTQKKVNMTGAVSTVDTKMLQNRPTSNVAQALQGTTPGLIVTRTSGQPGNEELNLQIRGVTTANGSVQPLIVLDGVTVPNSTLLTMNPNDIESMSVLKDAAAAAIYGAQAAGGVILITSKKGKSGKVTFDYIGQYGVDWTINVPKRLSLIDEATLVNLGNRAAGVGPEYSDIDLDNIRNNIPYIINPNDTNNYVYYNQEPLTDALLRDRSSMQTHNISARGGSDKFNFMVSAGAYHKQGIFKLGPDNNARYNLRINLKAQLTNNVSLEALTAYTNEQVNTSSAGANGTGLLYEVYRLRTRTPFFTPEGRYNGAGSAASAYAVLESGGYNKLRRNYFDGTFTLRATDVGVKGLNLRAVAGTQFRPENRNVFFRTVPLWGRNSISRFINQVNAYQVTRDLTKSLNLQFLADYSLKIKEKHNFTALVGYQWEDFRLERVFTGANNLVSNDLPALNLGDDLTKSNSEAVETRAFQSIFGRFSYNYTDKYLVEVTVRQDESSKLAPGLRTQIFPAASVGWNLHREPWFANTLRFVSEFKLRGSWGRLGGALGNTIGEYDYLNQLARASNLVLGDARTSYIAQTFIPSAALSWETIETTNGGVDLGFFENRLQANIDYYVKYNRNMLTPQQLPATIGIATPRKNNGELKSWGWELDLRYRDRIGKDFNYNISLNVSDNKNELISFSGRRVINTGLNSLIEGYPINTLWGYQTNGYFSTADEVKASAFQDSRTGPGDVRYIDRNGDGRITLGKGSVEDFGDMVLIGSDQPRLLFGATIGFDWKGFDFMAFFQGVGERYFRPTTESIAPRLVTWKQPIAIHADYWTPENPNAFYPRPFTGATHNYLASDKWTLNGRYMRLKNLQFGYTIPNKLTQKLNLSKVRVFFSGQDLATWSALKQFAGYYDPENRNNVENDYPFFSSATGGLNISF